MCTCTLQFNEIEIEVAFVLMIISIIMRNKQTSCVRVCVCPQNCKKKTDERKIQHDVPCSI